jgi:hypothetical protein
MARRFRVGMKKNVNIPRVVAKVAGTIIALYVGNEIISQVGSIVNATTGAFNPGFKLIGWEVGTSTGVNGTAGCLNTCGLTPIDGCAAASPMTGVANCVNNASSGGVLSVVGVVGLASIVMEFVQFNM